MKQNEHGIPVVNREELNKLLTKIASNAVNKGIVLMGIPGTGKTTIIKKFLNDIKDAKIKQIKDTNKDSTEYRIQLKIDLLRPEYSLKSTNDLVTHYMETGKVPTSKNIDDLGTEPIANHYGTTLDVIPFIIQNMYSNNKDFGYYTTNLSYNELVERYGKRIVERLQEKCYILHLEDTNFRNIKGIKEINQELK